MACPRIGVLTRCDEALQPSKPAPGNTLNPLDLKHGRSLRKIALRNHSPEFARAALIDDMS